MTIREIERLLKSRQLSTPELIADSLHRIKTGDRWNCFITLTEELALDQARTRDSYPVAYKDLFYTKGVRTTAGSRLFADFVPDYDADIVKSSTGICIGKCNLHELAFGATSQSSLFGPVLNPLDPTRIPGGSSGGSAAAVAARFVPLAWGTDTGGSIRVPASYCGVVGFKPTYGRFSSAGVLPLSWSLDHVGPIAASVEDCAIALGLPLAHLERLDEVRVGVPDNFFFDHLDDEVSGAVQKVIAAMQSLGAQLLRIQVPDPAEASAAARLIQWAEFAAQYAKYTDPALFSDDIRALREQGLLVAAHDYVNAQRLRSVHREAWDAIWREVDLLVTPTTPITAPKRDQRTVNIGPFEEDVRIASTRLVRTFNYTGEPAISLPCGKDRNGLPIGLQLVAKPNADERLLAYARTISSSSGL